MCDRHREKYRVRQKERSSWKWYNMVSLQNGINNLAIVQAKYKKSCLLWLSSGIGVIDVRHWRQCPLRLFHSKPCCSISYLHFWQRGAEFQVTQRYKPVLVAPKHSGFLLYFISLNSLNSFPVSIQRAIHMYTQAVQPTWKNTKWMYEKLSKIASWDGTIIVEFLTTCIG